MAEKEELAEPSDANPPTGEDMDLETTGSPAPNPDDEANNKGSNPKRRREEDGGECDEVPKKQNVQKSVEEERLEKTSGSSEPGLVRLGPKEFSSSVEMFDCFIRLLHNWPTHCNFNTYEQMLLSDLLKKGHPEPDKKIGGGIKAFEIRTHPKWKSDCFFVIREDGTVDDFSFRKCVDCIRPLPEEFIKPDANRALGTGGWRGHGDKGGARGRGRKGGGRGRGRGGGKSRTKAVILEMKLNLYSNLL